VVERPDDALHLDRETVAHLELFEGLRRGDRETTVFHHLNATRTPMGRRCLARWLRAPLSEVEAIERRLDAVQWLVDHPPRRDRLVENLQGMGDLERVLGRVATARVLPHELAQLRDGLARLPRLAESLEGADQTLLREVPGVTGLATEMSELLARALVEQPPTHLRTGGVFAPGHDVELDRLRELTTGGKQWVARYQESERGRTGIGSLKVGYNKVFGYYLEVTNPHLGKVPADYQEKQTLAGGKRFVTPALKEREQQILRAEEDRVARESELFVQLVRSLVPRLDDVHRVVDAVAQLDTLASLAQVAARRHYVRPVVDEGRRLDVSEGRHLVVERISHEPFVPNDVELDPQRRQILLLTGPNMGGKSTYLRQTALVVVLAQIGSFVPAANAHVGVVDRLFTRVGASDNLARGQSTFLVEMSETANILRNATDSSLVILDEVGRGTSTDDGLALAHAITEYLHDGPVRPKTLFATHFHQLTSLEEQLPRLANVQMEVREWEGEILFLHRVVSGASDRSYGVHVAQLAGVPGPVLQRAMELLTTAEQATDPPRTQAPPSPASTGQLSLFTPAERGVLDRLQEVDPDRMRPVEALQLLADLVDRLRRG
jgi:DNA mismatch repair protein MutS